MRNLKNPNKVLLCKCSWHFAMKREGLWRKVICGKYGEEEGGWRSHEVRDRHEVCLGRL